LAAWTCCGGQLPEKMGELNRPAPDLAVVRERPRPPTDLPEQLCFGQRRRMGLAVLAGPCVDIGVIVVGPCLPPYVVPMASTSHALSLFAYRRVSEMTGLRFRRHRGKLTFLILYVLRVL